MANYQIFIVGSSNDYTRYLRTNDYSVTREDVLVTWTDANHITRADVVRTRISGSLHLVMKKAIYETFLTHWAAARNADGSHNIQVHVDNATTATEVTAAKVFATMETKVVYGTPGYRYDPTAMDIVITFEEA